MAIIPNDKSEEESGLTGFLIKVALPTVLAAAIATSVTASLAHNAQKTENPEKEEQKIEAVEDSNLQLDSNGILKEIEKNFEKRAIEASKDNPVLGEIDKVKLSSISYDKEGAGASINFVYSNKNSNDYINGTMVSNLGKIDEFEKLEDKNDLDAVSQILSVKLNQSSSLEVIFTPNNPELLNTIQSSINGGNTNAFNNISTTGYTPVESQCLGYSITNDGDNRSIEISTYVKSEDKSGNVKNNIVTAEFPIPTDYTYEEVNELFSDIISGKETCDTKVSECIGNGAIQENISLSAPSNNSYVVNSLNEKKEEQKEEEKKEEQKNEEELEMQP